jgi:hypothetical protein
MLTDDYAKKSVPGNSLGLHYSHFGPLSTMSGLANQALAD